MGKYAHYELPKQIVLLSTADWDAPLWTNKQQIAVRLVEDFEVVYVEPVAVFLNPKRGRHKKVWTDPSGVTVYRPFGALPLGNKLWPVNEVNWARTAADLANLLRDKGFTQPLVWCYPPTSQPLLKHLPHELSCYDCVDEYSAFPGAWITAVNNMERKLMRAVDAVFTTAKSLYEAKRKYNPHTYFVPNVADFEHFHQAATATPNLLLRDMNRPVIGFVGALNYKLDADLLRAVCAMRPEWSLVFVGPEREFNAQQFIGCANAHFLGRKDIAELPAIMAGFDCCMIPYKVDRYTHGVLPLKFFEYLATGKPVITTPLPELEAFHQLVDVVTSAETFVEAVERRLVDDPHVQQRVALAAKNSWEHRIHSMLTHLETIHHQKARGQR
ncbi:MAG TPA: glycosyltransferase [bacterium]|nr:glycosyltransferase [bacterium]